MKNTEQKQPTPCQQWQGGGMVGNGGNAPAIPANVNDHFDAATVHIRGRAVQLPPQLQGQASPILGGPSRARRGSLFWPR